jgi:hypothetical protein
VYCGQKHGVKTFGQGKLNLEHRDQNVTEGKTDKTNI